MKPLKEVKKKKVVDEKPLDNDAVIRAARAVTGNADSDESSDGDDIEVPAIKHDVAPQKSALKKSEKSKKA